MTHTRRLPIWKLLVVAPAFAGCGGESLWIEPPEISAKGSAEEAMKLYDTDGDGQLNASELEAAPGLRAAIKTLDTDGDAQVSQIEITDRILAWQKYKAGLTSIMCDVTLNGQPLEGATVTFIPESFLGDDIKTASGVTTRHGAVSPTIPKENRPTPEAPSGLQFGLYRVQISKLKNGKETIPAKYNTETILGQQVATDDPAIAGRNLRFVLKSR